MAVKVQVARLDIPEDILCMVSRKLLLLQQLINDVRLKEEISRKRNAVSLFYLDLSKGDLRRVRNSVLNGLRRVSIPVTMFIDEGLQLASGHVVPRRTGPTAKKLGLLRVFGAANDTKEERLLLAEAKTSANTASRDAIGENLYVMWVKRLLFWIKPVRQA